MSGSDPSMRTSAWGTGAEPAGSARVFVWGSIMFAEEVVAERTQATRYSAHWARGHTSVTRYDIEQFCLSVLFLLTLLPVRNVHDMYRRLKRLNL